MVNRLLLWIVLVCFYGLISESPSKAQSPAEIDKLAIRIASEVCIREFERAGAGIRKGANPSGGWRYEDLDHELKLLAESFRAQSQAEQRESPAVQLASLMTLKVAMASCRLAANDVEGARREIKEATELYDEKYERLSETQKAELNALNYAGNQHRLLATLHLMLTADRIEKCNLASTIRDPGRKKLTLWKAESVLPSVQARLECLLLDLDRYVANLNSVKTVDEGSVDSGDQGSVVAESDSEKRKNCELLKQTWSWQTFRVIAAVHEQFIDAKELLQEEGDSIRVASIQSKDHRPLVFLGVARLDTNGDGNVTTLEVDRLHASFDRDYPLAFLKAVLTTLGEIERELEASDLMPEGRLLEITTSNGFEAGKIYRVKDSVNRVLYYDFLSYAQSVINEKTNEQITKSTPCISRGNFKDVYAVAVENARFLTAQGLR